MHMTMFSRRTQSDAYLGLQPSQRLAHKTAGPKSKSSKKQGKKGRSSLISRHLQGFEGQNCVHAARAKSIQIQGDVFEAQRM